MSAFTVALPHVEFEGPLALLLHLIERRELDITRLSLAAVTDDFLGTIRTLEGQADPNELADFLLIAARLLLIKSASLLPAPAAPQADEEDEGEALARMLAAYRQFKQVALALGEREAQGLRAYARLVAPPEMERRLDPQGLTPDDLLRALRLLLRDKEPEPDNVDSVVRPLRITVRQRIGELAAALRGGQPLPFSALLSQAATRQEVIATFLAMLELLKLGWARADQSQLWGQIVLAPLAALPSLPAAPPLDEVDEYQ